MPLFILHVMQVTIGTREDPDNVLTLAEVKRHLRVTHSLEDSLITAIRNASIRYVEQYCNTSLGRIEAYGHLSHFHLDYFPLGPVATIDKVEYETDNTGTLSILNGSKYHYDLKTEPARIAFTDVPAPYEYALMPIKITFTYGHATGGIPPNIIAAVLLICGHLYENRQAEITGTITTSLKLGVDALLSTERILYQP